MTIASALADLNTDIQNARTAITNKGGTVTADGGSSQLATDIGTITELKGETRSVQITSTSGNTFTPTSGKNAITSITVTPTNQAKTITPTTSSQSISVPSGYSGFGTLAVDAVTASIDANITAGNIKNGVSILGVTGTLQSGYSELPNYQVVNGVASKRSGALTGNEFSNITSVSDSGLANAFQGCTGLTGTLNLSSLTSIDLRGLSSSFSGCTGLTSVDLSSLSSVGKNGLQGAFSNCTSLTSVDLSSLESVDDYGLSNAFYYCTGLTSVDLSSLANVGSYGANYAFTGCTGLTSVDLSSLASVGVRGLPYTFQGCTGLTGALNLSSLTSIDEYGLYYAFNGCTGLTSIDLSSLTSVGARGLYYAFQGCTGLTNIYFNSLTTTSFGSSTDQFQNMLYSTGSSVTHTLHFPSNIQSTIQGLSGYPTFGGNSNRVICAFDLPATS